MHERVLLLGLLLMLRSVGLAQPVLVLEDRLPSSVLNLAPYTATLTDSSDAPLPLAAIRQKPFGRFDERKQLVMPGRGSNVANWLRFTLRNSSPTDTLRLIFYTGMHARIELHQQTANQPETVVTRGFYMKRDSLFGVPDRDGLPMVLLPGRTYQCWVKVSDIFRYFDPVYARLYTPDGYKAFVAQNEQQNRPTLLFMVGLLACLLFVCLFSLLQYASNRDRAYLIYGAYLFVTAAWILRSLELSTYVSLVSRYAPALLFKSTMTLGYAIQIAYLLFLSSLLTVRKSQPRLWRWLRRYIIAVMALTVMSGISTVVDGFLGSTYAYYALLSGLNYGLVLVFLVALVRGPHPLRLYVVVGSLCLLLGTVVAIYLNGSGSSFGDSLTDNPTFYLSLGTLLEVLCFSTALGRRSYLVEVEKNRIQEQYTVELQHELAERTDEVLRQSRLLEDQRVRQLQTEFDHKLADTEMTALRAQMNPHFIFNCLNSIKLYTLQNDTDKASDYLSKFARLIRLVLENSRADRVSLQNELEALRLYIELEAMRFKEKVQFDIIVAPAIDQEGIHIPPLLIQPYVENAIWHGLMHKSEGGTVTVTVSQFDEDRLAVEIIDNGVGRARAEVLKSKSAGKHKSVGMQVTADRIQMINQLYNLDTQAQIIDLVAPDGEPLGTKVVLEIPV